MTFLVLSGILLVFFLWVYNKKVKINIVKTIIIALLVRTVFVYLSHGVSNYDLDSYHLVGEVTQSKIDIYPTVASLHHPYFPVFLYLEAFAMYIQKWNISYVIFLKSIFILFDIGVLYMVYILSKKNENNALLYALNPISTLIVAVQGQFDSLPVLLLLLAYYYFEKSKFTASMIIASAAIATKTWPILFIIPLIKRIPLKYIPMLALFPIVSVVVYTTLFGSSVKAILETIYSYRGIVGNYGLGWIIANTPEWTGIFIRLLSYIVMVITIVFIYRKKGSTLLSDVISISLVFFSVTIGFGIQWLLWIIPFLLLTRIKGSQILFIFATLYLTTVYYSWVMKYDVTLYIVLLGLLLWITIVYVTISYSITLKGK